MKYIVAIFLLANIQARAEQPAHIICRVVGKTIYSNNAKVKCYDAYTVFDVDFENGKFEYSTQFGVPFGEKFCGWPPAGDYAQGSLEKIENNTYQIKNSEIAGTLTYENNLLNYQGAFNEMSLICTEKKEQEL